MGLFGLFSKKKPAKPTTIKPTKTNSASERLDRLTADGDLPFGWVYANRDFIGKIEGEYKHFFSMWCDSKDKGPKEQYAALKSFVTYMNDAKKLCTSKGECFAFWQDRTLFDDAYIKELTEKMKFIKDHYDDLEDEYQREQYIKHCVLPEIPKIIRKNPGILQTDIYKMYPVDCKNHISSELYMMARNGKIVREKSGRTYSLTIVSTKKKARA